MELPTTVEKLLEMASNVRLGDTNREGAVVVDPRLVVLEHVTRVTAQVLPVTELILAMSGKHTHSLVDGNDALGMLPNLCLPEVGCSFYVCAPHKWMFASAGTAFLWAQAKCQAHLRPLTTSYFAGGSYGKVFSYQGLLDFSVFTAFIQAYQFMQYIGGMKRMQAYCNDLAEKAVQMMQERWLTEAVAPPGEKGKYYRLPLIPLPPINGIEPTDQHAQQLMGWLYARGLTTAILVVKLDSVPTLCVRLAIQVFHCLADFEALAEAVCQLQTESSTTPASLKGLEVELANPQAIVMDHALFSLADLNSSAMFDVPRGMLRKCTFGKTMLVQHFSMNQTVLQFNSASYGQTPTIVNNARAQWEALSHANPSCWQAARLYSQLQRVRARVADFFVADHDGLVLTQNANTATSIVLKNIKWEPGDSILLFSVDYHATELCTEELHETLGLETFKVVLELPMSDAEILKEVREVLPLHS